MKDVLKLWEIYTNIVLENISLNDIYGDLENVDEDELLYHMVDPNDGDIKLPVRKLQPDDIKRLQIDDANTTLWEAYEQYATRGQKEIVDEYVKNMPSKPIIVKGNLLVDGYHRAIASLIRNTPIHALDLKDL